MIQTILVDDERLAREGLKNLLKEHTEIQIIGEAANVDEALDMIDKLKPQLIFLDIQMPEKTGFDLLEDLIETPSIIFTTAYDEFAIKAFEVNALDYLLKPFSHERFKLAINKWLQNPVNSSASKVSLTEIPHKQPEEQNRIVIKDGSEISIIPTSELEYLEAYDDYVKIHHKGKVHLKKKTMNYFEQLLNPAIFIRIHRSYILNINELAKIESFEKNSYLAILRSGKRIPISRTAYAPLKEILGI
jgi:two-component system LytT family response regulator